MKRWKWNHHKRTNWLVLPPIVDIMTNHINAWLKYTQWRLFPPLSQCEETWMLEFHFTLVNGILYKPREQGRNRNLYSTPKYNSLMHLNYLQSQIFFCIRSAYTVSLFVDQSTCSSWEAKLLGMATNCECSLFQEKEMAAYKASTALEIGTDMLCKLVSKVSGCK